MDISIINSFFVISLAIVVVFLILIYFWFNRRKIKGNISTSGEKIYYTKEHRLYNFVKPEVMFKTIEEAEKAGFRSPKR